MLAALPRTADEVMNWKWSQIAPYYDALAERPLQADTVEAWLADWSTLANLLDETRNRLEVAQTRNTDDKATEQRFETFLAEVFPEVQKAEQTLKEKLIDSGLEPANFSVPLRDMRAEASLYEEANVGLLSEEYTLNAEYNKISGAQTVEWDGAEVPIFALQPVAFEQDRSRREAAWRLAAQRGLEDRDTMNALWVKLLTLRRQLADNADFADYRAYRWQQLKRFDYTPADSIRFQEAVEAVAVPALRARREKRRQQLGLDSLRPWDLQVDPSGRPPLKPFESTDELETKGATIFHKVDPQVGAYFETMRREGLLDLPSRKNKAPAGYCTFFPTARRPFIFMNAVGVHRDVVVLLHEFGHALHIFETIHLPYSQQLNVPVEFAEVASMSMELLGAPYLGDLGAESGGFYNESDTARARVQQLETILLLLTGVAQGDAFQHWIYENPDLASDPAACDAKYAELTRRFRPGVDWTGLETEMGAAWHDILHFFQVPFYYIEYGIAQLGAIQVWANAQRDQHAAVAQYRHALSLGGTATLPELFEAAGAKFAFDVPTFKHAIGLVEKTLADLESN